MLQDQQRAVMDPLARLTHVFETHIKAVHVGILVSFW